MRTIIALVTVTAGSLLGVSGPVRGQEVNSDVSIPTPQGDRDHHPGGQRTLHRIC